MLNKRTNCVEESIHVVFDENSCVFETNMRDDYEMEHSIEEQVMLPGSSIGQPESTQPGGTIESENQSFDSGPAQLETAANGQPQRFMVKSYKY